MKIHIKDNNPTRKSKKILFSFVTIILTIIVIVVLMIVVGKKDSGTNGAIGYDSNMQKKTVDTGTEEKETLPSVTMPGWKSITIAANETNITSGINFFNPYQNEDYYDLQFELLVDISGTGDYKSIYKSGLVSPNKTIEKITLTESLEKGEYDAIVFIQPYIIGDTGKMLNNGQVNIKLIAQ